MSLSVDLIIERTSLIFQENPLCRLIAANNGNQAIQVTAPGSSPDVPTLRVTEVKTGIETLQHRPARPSGTAYQELGPGKKLDYEFRLNSIARLTLPTEYEVSAVLYYDQGARHADSKPVRLKLMPATLRDLALVYGQGGWSTVLFGVAVNAAADPPQVVRYEFEIKAEGGVVDVRPVANASLRAAPLLSAPPNNNVINSHWVMWQEGQGLVFSHFDPLAGALPPVKWQPPEPEFVPVAPLASLPQPDDAARPAGGVLVWVGDPARRVSAFQSLEIDGRGQVHLAGRCDVPDGCPRWMMSHTKSDGRRLVTYASDTAKGSALYLRPWPGAGAAGEPRLLTTWTSHCLAGGAVIVEDDTIYGATLLRSQEREGSQLELRAWRLNPKAEFAQREPVAIPWNYLTPVAKAIIRVSNQGQPAALLSDDTGKWTLVDVDGVAKSVPADLSRTQLPLELAFLNGTDVCLIAGQPASGFKVVMANGDPLPHLHG